MVKDCVLVLGSGKSILDLSINEQELLNTCEVKIGINKYTAFYELAGIEPSHVYFEDVHDLSSILMLKHIFKLLRKKNKKEITFIVSELYKNQLYKNQFSFLIIKIRCHVKVFLNFFLVNLGRKTLKLINTKLFNEFVFYLSNYLKTKPILFYNLIPKKAIIQFINIRHCENKENFWAYKLNEPLYHFKGSFSSVLNYISICFPNKTILLAGVDFDTSDYFFEDELEKLNFKTKDWTYDLRKKYDKHYSILETNGVKIDDAFPFMLEKLKETNNKMYSLTEKSYLVKSGFVEKIDLKIEL